MVNMLTECPHCRKRYHVKTELAGQTAHCCECGASFTVREYVTRLDQYHASDNKPPEPEDDDILSTPIQTPSWRETPVLRTSFDKTPGGNAGAGTSSDDDSGRTPVAVGEEAPAYWALRIGAKLHTYLGVLAMVIGVVLIAAATGNSSAGGDATGHLACAWGAALVLYGTLALTLSRALIALRDIAINSYLAAR